MKAIVFILLIHLPATGHTVVGARYDSKESCMAAREHVMSETLFQASCVPLTTKGMLP